jgi:PST family polysaccharide transporter
LSDIKTIAKNTLILALPKVVRFFIGIVNAKLVAVYLGPVGSGITSQLQNIVMNISVFANGGLVDGMVKQICNANADNANTDEIKKILKTFAVTIGFTTILAFILGLIFSVQLTQYVFGNQKYYTYFIIGFLGLPICIISSSSFAILKAYKKVKSLMYAEIAVIIINFVFFFALLFFFKLTGAVIHITLTYLITFLVYRYYANKDILKHLGINFISITKTEFSKKHFRELLTFFSIAIVVGFTTVLTDVSTRSIVATHLGIDKIGIYSPIVSWAGLFTSLILPSLGIYLFPRLSEAKSSIEITGVINDVFRIMTFILTLFVFVAIPLRSYLIPLFYSKEYADASIYLPFHFVGLFLFVWNYIFMLSFTPTGRIKNYFPLVILQNILDFAIVYYLVPKIGLWGWLARFTISPFIMSFIYYFYWHHSIKFRFSKENYLLLFFIFISSIFVITFRNNFPVCSSIGLIAIILLWFIMKKEERKFLLSKIPFYKPVKK